MEAPEDNDGWSSAEELINSSDAEEEGRVGPRKLVTLGPLGPSVRHGWPLGGRAPERDHGGAVALVAVGGGCRVSLWLCAHPPPPSEPCQTGSPAEGTEHTPPGKGSAVSSVRKAVRTALPHFRELHHSSAGLPSQQAHSLTQAARRSRSRMNRQSQGYTNRCLVRAWRHPGPSSRAPRDRTSSA